jgi:hypothetical protein
MLTYQIGSFLFHGMWGTPDFPEAAIGTETRAGVNGTTLHNLGVWGKPFQTKTIVGVADYNTAIAVCELYKTATAFDPLFLAIGSIPIAGGLFKVMSVESDAKRVVWFKVAGDSTYYGAIVRSNWTLLPIANT